MKTSNLQLSSFDIPESILEILSQEGITNLYPPQAEALPHALAGDNLVLAIPTASGKSLIAYLAMLRSVLAGGKALYIVPLRALASEKFDDLKKFEALGIKIALSMGNLDSPDPKLNEFDIIIATSEKTDSLLRHRSHWLKNITVIVADEIHLINDPHRGPTLELILARFRQVNQNAQIIGLSATIQNSIELSVWLDAKHVQSDWRPTKLMEGIYFDNSIQFMDNTSKDIPTIGDEITSLVLDTINDGAQVLVFVNSRRSTEAVAKRLATKVHKLLPADDKKTMNEICKKFVSSHTEVTTQVRQLSELLASGVAFHHAGLADAQRKLIEKNFKKGLIKCIIATPTLAAGINLPARRVIIRDVTRYNAELGIPTPIPVLEIKQMMGRAGRPKYDTFGEAVLLAKRLDIYDELRDRYLLHDTEPIYSKLSMEPALRTHVLAAIASDFVGNVSGLEKYIGNSFYAYQSDTTMLSQKLEDVLQFLEQHELIENRGEGNNLFATEFGRRTSDLYIDPETAFLLRSALENAGDADVPEFAFLHSISATPAMLNFYLRKSDYKWLQGVVDEECENLILSWDDSTTLYEDYLGQLKTACMLNDWIEERSEEYISNKYNIGPGDIRNKAETGKWLLHAMYELAKLFNKHCQPIIHSLNVRVDYGVSAELLDLVSLKGIGRVRARSLFKHGYQNKKLLQEAEEAKLARIPSIGPIIAANIKSQV